MRGILFIQAPGSGAILIVGKLRAPCGMGVPPVLGLVYCTGETPVPPGEKFRVCRLPSPS